MKLVIRLVVLACFLLSCVMITIKDERAFAAMRVAGRLLAELFEEVKQVVVAGASTLDIDTYVAAYLHKNELISQSKGYCGYKHVSCISLNDEVVHGVPHGKRVLVSGDLVKIDVCAAWNGYCADMARCFFVDVDCRGVDKLIVTAHKALDAGIACAFPGKRLTDISYAIQKEIEQGGFGIVRDFAGHGIGKNMHEDPEILNYGKPGRGPVIKAGMAFAIEPMLTEGDCEVYVDRDGWTAKTVDGSLAAHVEDTILVTSSGCEIVTRL